MLGPVRRKFQSTFLYMFLWLSFYCLLLNLHYSSGDLDSVSASWSFLICRNHLIFFFWQLSLLTTFYDILAEQKSCPCQEYADIVNFLTSLIRKMLEKMKKQPLLFVEILFWKTRRECHYINAEYLLHELGHKKKQSKDQEKKLGDVDVGSSNWKGWTNVSIADALGEDEADVVISRDLENDE